MEFFKKYGKSSWAKHLRKKKKSPRTKQMANKKSRVKSKKDLIGEFHEEVQIKLTKQSKTDLIP